MADAYHPLAPSFPLTASTETDRPTQAAEFALLWEAVNWVLVRICFLTRDGLLLIYSLTRLCGYTWIASYHTILFTSTYHVLVLFECQFTFIQYLLCTFIMPHRFFRCTVPCFLCINPILYPFGFILCVEFKDGYQREVRLMRPSSSVLERLQDTSSRICWVFVHETLSFAQT